MRLSISFSLANFHELFRKLDSKKQSIGQMPKPELKHMDKQVVQLKYSGKKIDRMHFK
jgi:hypothetical protein